MKITQISLGIIVLALVGVGAWKYYEHGLIYPSTDDAFLKANIIEVSPQISGRVVEVLAESNAQVLKGDVLVRIDPTSYQFAVDQAQATFDMAAKQAGVQSAAVVSARANVQRVQAALNDAKSHDSRIQTLLEKGLAGQDAADHANALYLQAQSAFDVAQANLQQAIQAFGSDASSVQETTNNLASTDTAELRKAVAALEQAKYDLSNTDIKAPYSGILGDVNVRPGNMIRAQQPLFPLIEDHDYWIEANFKETDLARIKIGQTVSIVLDMYDGQTLEGEVSSISPASGASFSLLPPENATGNWVKVTQRFPIRVSVKSSNDSPPLRIGASASIEVDTTSKQP